ncbi:TetR/AcrR family transcriptional regulator [Paeniglutamicibacter sp. R2-26]|uniref:TetR/AcrR family transcriptional regulator n=1 Tax=Paeniglutamicibacter sp. R2-26 TaxID=3144417 RepID=UPI003EE52411
MAVDNQTRILEACARRISENGVRGMRVQDVAKEAGVSSGLLYYHFTDRDGLLAATLRYVNDSSLSRRHGLEARTDESYAEIRRHLLAEIEDVDTVKANSIVWNEIRAIAVFEPALAEHLEASTAAWQSFVADLVRAHRPMDEPAAQQISLLLTTLVEGLSGRWLSGQITTEQAQAALDAGIEALVPRH